MLPLDFNALVYLWGCEFQLRQTLRIKIQVNSLHLLEHELRDKYNAKLKTFEGATFQEQEQSHF